jgi:hypothetical protein
MGYFCKENFWANFGEAYLVFQVSRGNSEGCRAGIWCAPSVFLPLSEYASYLVGISDVEGDKLLCDHAQHNY